MICLFCHLLLTRWFRFVYSIVSVVFRTHFAAYLYGVLQSLSVNSLSHHLYELCVTVSLLSLPCITMSHHLYLLCLSDPPPHVPLTPPPPSPAVQSPFGPRLSPFI